MWRKILVPHFIQKYIYVFLFTVVLMTQTSSIMKQ